MKKVTRRLGRVGNTKVLVLSAAAVPVAEEIDSPVSSQPCSYAGGGTVPI